MIRPMISSMIRPMVGMVKDICRWFSNFNGTDSYAEFTDDIVLSGDFEIEYDIPEIDKSVGFNFRIFSGYTESSQPFVGYGEGGGGSLSIRSDTTIATFTANSFEGGNVRFALVGSTIHCYVDEVEIGTGEPFGGTFTTNLIGMYSAGGGLNMYGQISNIKITDGTTQIVNMPMDERYLDLQGRIIYNNLARQEAWYLRTDGSLNAGLTFEDVAISSSDDFEFQADIRVLIVDSFHLFANSLTNYQGRFFYDGNQNRFKFDDGSGQFTFATTPLIMGVKYEVILIRESGLLTLSLNGISETLPLVSTGQSVMNSFISVRGGVTGIGVLNGNWLGCKFWNNGDRNTGTKVLDYDFQSLSNVIPNLASTTSANLWDGSIAEATGESSVISDTVINVLRTGASNSQVSAVASVSGQDVLVQVTVDSGSLNNIICGFTSVEFTGWESVRDANQQPIPNRFQTITNVSSDFVVFKTNGIADVTLSGITSQTVTGYGVLNGTLGTDYEYKNDSPNAIGYNITTTQDPECSVLPLFVNGILQGDGTLTNETILGE